MKKSHGALRKSATNCAVGGPIKGKGTGTSDDVPIMASNGEFMIKAKAAKVIGPEVLEALNEIADKPDEKDSKAESMREYGEGSESETHEAAEDSVEGMKCGGAVRKMAGGGYVAKEMATGVPHMEAAGYVDEAEKRAQLLAQIPTGGTGTGPTPQPDPTQSASGTDFGRNVNNSLNALGGMGVVASVPLKGTQAASSAIRGAVNAPPVLQNSIPRLAAPAAQAVPDFVAGSSGVAKVGGANLPAISSMTPVSKVTNVALQEGAMANQMAGNARTLGNASAGLGVLDQRQTTPATEPAAPQSDYARQMSEMSASAMRGLGNIGQAAKTMAMTAVSAPGYGFSSNNPTAPADASPYPSVFDGSPKAPTTPAPQGTPAAAVQPAGALPRYSPAMDSQKSNLPVQGGDIPTPTDPVKAPPMLNGQAGKDVGYGATRFDVPGKSPLFTNMTDSAGMASNTALTNRGAISPQNQGALDGIQARQDIGDRNRAIKSQYDAEVAQAQAINEAGRRMNLEYDLKNGNAKEREAAKLILQGIDSTEKDKRSNSLETRGQDITAQGQAVQAGALRANQKLAQDKFVLEQAKDSRDSTSASLDHKARQQLFDAQQEMLNAGDDPVKQKAAERKLMALGNRQPQNDQYAYAPGGQVIDPTTGQTVTQAGVIFNKATGQTVQQGQQMKSAPPAKALEMLKANPKLAAEFDAKYGPGASAQYLAKK